MVNLNHWGHHCAAELVPDKVERRAGVGTKIILLISGTINCHINELSESMLLHKHLVVGNFNVKLQLRDP